MAESEFPANTPSNHWRLPVLILAVACLVSACTSQDETTRDPDEPTTITSDVSTSTISDTTAGPTSGDGREDPTYPCDTSIGGVAQIQVLNDVPRREDISGARPPDEEETPNEEQMPPTPDDPDAVVPDLTDFPPALESPRGAQDDPQTDDPVLYRLPTTIDGRGNTLTIAEPHIATDGEAALLTWNQFAAMSDDGGVSFKYLSPWQFPRVDGGFCCDQLALHVLSRDIWLWYLQYREGDDGENTIRLAYTDDGGLKSGEWSYIDWTPETLGLSPGTMIDFPHIATTNEYVYLTTNSFEDDLFTQAIVIRIPLDALVPGSSRAVPASCMIAEVPESYDAAGFLLGSIMPTKGATDTMYLASHINASTLGIFIWPDEATAPTFATVTDFDDAGLPIKYPIDWALNYECPRDNGGPETNWCLRSDDRLISAWVANGRLGFAWNAQQVVGAVPFPFVWVVVLDERRVESCVSGDCVTSYPIIYLPSAAIQYAAIRENARGELGAVALVGGGSHNLSCVALVHDSEIGWTIVPVGVSNADLPIREGAVSPETGDYLGITPDSDGSMSWMGTCMSFSKASGTDEGTMLIHVARFGLHQDSLSG